MLHEVEERVCDEMINVSDNVHDNEVETTPFRQVVLLLDIDLQQFVVMKEEQVTSGHRKVIERKFDLPCLEAKVLISESESL